MTNSQRILAAAACLLLVLAGCSKSRRLSPTQEAGFAWNDSASVLVSWERN